MVVVLFFLLPATSFASWPLIIWYYWHCCCVVFSALNNVLERYAAFCIMSHIFTTAFTSARVVFVREHWEKHKGLHFLFLSFSFLPYKVITIFIIFLIICYKTVYITLLPRAQLYTECSCVLWQHEHIKCLPPTCCKSAQNFDYCHWSYDFMTVIWHSISYVIKSVV